MNTITTIICFLILTAGFVALWTLRILAGAKRWDERPRKECEKNG